MIQLHLNLNVTSVSPTQMTPGWSAQPSEYARLWQLASLLAQCLAPAETGQGALGTYLGTGGFGAAGFGAGGFGLAGFGAAGFGAGGFGLAGFGAAGFGAGGFGATGFGAAGFGAGGFGAAGFGAGGFGLAGAGYTAGGYGGLGGLGYATGQAGGAAWGYGASSGGAYGGAGWAGASNGHYGGGGYQAGVLAGHIRLSGQSPMKMWDVWFDHEAGQTTQQRSPIVLDLNGDGQAGITGKNITGDGKIDGPTTLFDLDTENQSYEFKSRARRPGKGAPAVEGGRWDGDRYLDAQGNLVGEIRDGLYYWGKQEAREKTEWLAKDGGDGFLVWDVDGDGQIASSKELFGNYDLDGKQRFQNGYEKLAHYFDANRDGRVEGFETAGLQIWKDADADGQMDAGELQSLADHGLTSFDVAGYDRTDMSSTATTTNGPSLEISFAALLALLQGWRA